MTPPPVVPGWYECETASFSVDGGITAALPQRGRLQWSDWGALELTATRAGTVILKSLVLAVPPTAPTNLQLTGNLAPDNGLWQAIVVGDTTAAPVTLTPGKNVNELITWHIPVAGLTLPGPVTLRITWQPSAATESAKLYLDCWSMGTESGH